MLVHLHFVAFLLLFNENILMANFSQSIVTAYSSDAHQKCLNNVMIPLIIL